MVRKSLNATRFLTDISLAVILVILPVLICGCQKVGGRVLRGTPTPKAGQISKEELREDLNNFQDFTSSALTTAALHLEELQPDFRTRRTNLIQRTRLRQAFSTMHEQDDPIVAFVETWALSVRFTNYIKDGEGSNLFKKNQQIAISAAEKIQEEIERIGKNFLEGDAFYETQKRIKSFANTQPIKGTFSNTIVYATEVKPGEKGLFSDVVDVPMAPFKAIGGVDRTASAIYGLRDSANRVSDVLKELPESSRWQMLLFLMEMQETEVIKVFLKSMSKLSESSVRFADSAEKFPEKLSVLIQELDKEQGNFHATLDKAQTTSASIEQTLKQAGKTAATFQSTTQSVNRAAMTWEKAAIATQQLVAGLKKEKKTDEEKETEDSFNIKDFQQSVKAVEDTLIQMQATTEEVHRLVESEKLGEYASIPQKLTNLLILRIGQLILLIFVLAFAYRIAVARFVKRNGKGK